jgi:phospholipase/carboxylesterase
MPLTFAERPARGDPDGLLVLHHGRGSDEQDLIGLAAGLDPDERRRVIAWLG